METSTQATVRNTQVSPNNSNNDATTDSGSKKRRLNEEEQEDGLGEDDMESDLDTDGELSLSDVEARKQTRAAFLAEQSSIRKRNVVIGKTSGAHPTPKAATPLARALYKYTRMMMGVPQKSSSSSSSSGSFDGGPTLPDPPNEDELRNWTTCESNRQVLIETAMEKAKTKYLARKPPGFVPNRTQIRTVEKDAAEMALASKPLRPVQFTSRLVFASQNSYAMSWAISCEGALARAGFPRCTFDWQASYDLPWNLAMSAIIQQEWAKCFNANGARSFGILARENSLANRDEIIRRWFVNKASKFESQIKRTKLMESEDGRKKVQENEAISKSMLCRRNRKLKLVKARQSMVAKLFGEGSQEALMLSHSEVHSEDEIKGLGSHGSQNKVRLQWRSAGLNAFIELIDKNIEAKEIIPKKRRAAKQLVDRETYSSTPDQESFPPKGYEQSLVSANWLQTVQGVAIVNLELKSTNGFDILKSVQEVSRMLTPGGLGMGNVGPATQNTTAGTQASGSGSTQMEI
ncbi:uncharacterized protein MELLADRAFT_88992 [Melampsora larici-populina 98AG31]|uniref:Uncharacterized protein n=1 Tax=Melampsora larici-populina (strain 98AG31 / pathotype 3-4-7) TaxID=747676 RepID=F4R6J7_MELLP|nr:uncharacterized protein MELLADRAFT_88992 [Melampsora larici-populina 98AG31]EGG12453.1 hypothetical protein MELLADRAFT_88992 [Melampsora larici-populina 98AG31]